MFRQVLAVALLACALAMTRASVELQGNAVLLNGFLVGVFLFGFVTVMDSKKDPR